LKAEAEAETSQLKGEAEAETSQLKVEGEAETSQLKAEVREIIGSKERTHGTVQFSHWRDLAIEKS